MTISDRVEPSVTVISAECWVAQWESTLMQFWGARTDAECVAKVAQLARAFVDGQPEPRVGLVYLEADSRPPDAAARAELAKLTLIFEGRLAALAYVYAGTGFKAAAIRSVMAAATMMNAITSSVAMRTFGATGEACEWLALRLPFEAQRTRPRIEAFDDVLGRFQGRAWYTG